MKKHVRKIKEARQRYREGPLTYVVSLLDLLILGLIVGGLYWLFSSPVAVDQIASEPTLQNPESKDIVPSAIDDIATAPNLEMVTSSPKRFVKMANDGSKLADDSDGWHCVLDRQHQLVWEVKPNDGSWRDKEHTYSWFSNAEDKFRGKEDGGTCSYIGCDTHTYINQLNQVRFCGFNDWRLPEQKEFQTLDHETNYFPDVDTRYFPNTMSGQYWTQTQNEYSETLAWSYDFSNGISYISEKRLQFHVRGVRGGR